MGRTHLKGKNNITVEGSKHIAEFLKVNYSLEKLYLNWNRLGNEGIANIAKKLADTAKTNVRVLEVNFNLIENIGAYHLSEMLKENVSLTHINLSLNEIGI